MKVGDYVRTKDGYISKIKELGINIYTDVGCWSEDYIIKSSPNIIDLIEVGDYVNGVRVNFVYSPDGKQVFRIELDVDDLKGHMICESKYITSIVTKEQFESMEYRIGE